MLQIGIVGLPNVGKSTLFNALTAGSAAAENYPFCTVEPNVGIVAVPDPRLEVVRALSGSAEAVPAHIRFVDIAGLVQGASEGEGLGNRFLAQIREVDALAHVLRCFEDADVTHVMGGADPVRDLGIVETELALADLETLERRKEKVEKRARSGEKDAQKEAALLGYLLDHLSREIPLRSIELPPGGDLLARELGLLTAKPALCVANVSEEGIRTDPPEVLRLREAGIGAGGPGALVKVCAGIEAELAQLDSEERGEFLAELGLEEDGLERVIRAGFGILDLITFFTANEKEARAWTVPRGTRAPEAAGLIHSDFQKGFIRGETISFRDLEASGSVKAARERGAVRAEGRDYAVEDGDLILFRFNL